MNHLPTRTDTSRNGVILLQGQTHGWDTNNCFTPIFSLLIVNLMQSFQIPNLTSLHVHSYYPIFRYLLSSWDKNMWTTQIVTNIAFLCKTGGVIWTEDNQWQNRLINLSKDNFKELFCRQVRWGWALALSTVLLKTQGCMIVQTILLLTLVVKYSQIYALGIADLGQWQNWKKTWILISLEGINLM